MNSPSGTDGDLGGDIDWAAVRDRLARTRFEAEEAGAFGSAWADALLRRRADELATGGSGAQEGTPTLPLLVGRGADGLYGLDLARLARVVPLPRVARVPGAPPDLLGLIAIDGRVVRLYDVDRLCGRTAVPAGGGFAVVLRGGARPVALRLRTVDTIVDLDLDSLRGKAPPEAGRFVTAVTDGRIAVVDVAAILDQLRSTKDA